MGRGLLLALLIGVVSAPVLADERGTVAEAQAMVADAIALYDEAGAEEAFAVFNSRDERFRDRDLYIFVISAEGEVVAQANDPSRVGLDAWQLKDAVGAPYGRKMLTRATSDGAWVDYLREDPLTGEVEEKSSWLVRHDGYVFGCGIYKPS